MTAASTPLSSESAEASALYRLAVTFQDNHILAVLCGAYDCHLDHFERTTGIEVLARGNHLILSGTPPLCEAIRHVLEALYQRIACGEAIGIGEIDDALRFDPIITAQRTARLNQPATKMQPMTMIKTLPIDPPDKDDAEAINFITPRRRVVARSHNQRRYMQALEQYDLVFGIGPAGSGKTYLAVAAGVMALMRNQVDRLIISRPAVEAGEHLGALPGDMKEKVDPYLRPLYDALYAMMPEARVERALECGEIEIAPLAFMRGRTFTNAFVILDEGQNCTAMQMKMFLTRLGMNSRMVVTGDPSQADLPVTVPSGLKQALSLLEDIAGIATIRLEAVDIVRHELVGKIVMAYDRATARDPQ